MGARVEIGLAVVLLIFILFVFELERSLGIEVECLALAQAHLECVLYRSGWQLDLSVSRQTEPCQDLAETVVPELIICFIMLDEEVVTS